ncbi:MAG: glycosyltransferase [Gammaproteobacteria bacterium]|jgi:1,2-diacylglycerol 3-alpha-glucosyltransferase
MRILMISDVYFPRINGVSTSTQIFREELQRAGHKVTLIAPNYPGCSAEDDIIRITSRQVLFDPEDRMMKQREVMALLPMLRNEKFDLIHIQTPFVAHRLGIRLAAALNLPSIETYHTFFEEYLFHYVPFVPKRWMRKLARYFTRRQCNAVNSVIVPSSAMFDVLERYGVTTRMKIIPTGLELGQFSDCDGAAFRRRYHIAGSRPTLVYIGRIAHEKNIDFLLRMLVLLRRQIPDILLILAGEGPALSHLKKLVTRLELNDSVLFVGYLSREDALLDCYCAGDAFIFASRTETQGLVLLEAMALGIPVVSTAVMGTKDILQPRRGALVAQENTQQFSDTLQQLLSNEVLRKRLGKEARDYVKEWSAATMANRLIEYYQQLIDTHRPAYTTRATSNASDS